MAEQRYYTEWLPDAVREEVLQQEPQRFSALSAAIRRAVAEAQQKAAQGDKGAWHSALVGYIPILNNFVDTRQLFATSEVVPLVHALLQVVCATTHDLEVQVRVADSVSRLLQHHKRVLSKPLHHEAGVGGAGSPAQAQQEEYPEEEEEGAGGAGGWQPPALVLDWKPLLHLLVTLYGSNTSPPAMEGVGLASTRENTLTTLVARCRRYFEPSAAVEVWALLKPAVHAVGHTYADAFEALGWLALFVPTNNIGRCGEAVANRLLSEWMEAWGLLLCCPHWDTLWVGLMGRLAKHDWKGLLDWRPHVDTLFTHMAASFKVPVGSATNAPATNRPAPTRTIILFASLLGKPPSHTARVAVHLLRACPRRPQTLERAQRVAARLAQLAALMDNYVHPSNTGHWSADLSTWLQRMVEEFMHQLGKQGPNPPPWTAYLHGPQQDVFVDLATSLSARAQFSKNDGLSRAAVNSLAQLAFVRPSKVLPLVVTRFRTALESATATHQLCAAITCLARSVRPMLLSGWGLEEETGPQMLAEALVALLPGLDANDEAKTLAVMHLYVAVLSSAPCIGAEEDDGPGVPNAVVLPGALPEGVSAAEAAVRIPVYVEEWAEDVVARLTVLLQNLDTGPGHRSTDAAAGRGNDAGGNGGNSGGSSFLLGGSSLFNPLIELLLTRLPKRVAASIARRIAQFASSETLPGVASAISTMLAEVSAHHPDVALNDFAIPTLSKVCEELRPSRGLAPGGAALHDISPTLESRACYQINLLQASLWHMPQQQALSLMPQVLQATDLCFLVASRPLHDAGAVLLRTLCRGLLDPHLSMPPSTMAPLGPNGALLLEWVDRTGARLERLRWDQASDATQRAQQLLDSYALQPVARLRQLLGLAPSPSSATSASGAQQDSGPAASAQSAQITKLLVHAEVVKVKGVLSGMLSHLHEFAIPSSGPAGGTPLHVAGGGVSPAVGGPSVREHLSRSLADIGNVLAGQSDAEAMGEFLVLTELLLCSGTLDYADSKGMESRTRKRAALLEEPPAAGLLVASHGNPGADPTSRPWRKRITHLAAVTSAYNMLLWRNSQRAFRGWATTDLPQLTGHEQLGEGFRTLLQCVCGMVTHPLRPVRSEAVAALSPVLTRFGALASNCLSHFLAHLADVPPPALLALLSSSSSSQSAAASGPLAAFERLLLSAAFRGVSPLPPGVDALPGVPEAAAGVPAAAAGGASNPSLTLGQGAGETQGDRDGRVDGAVSAMLHCLPFWRLMFRDATWHRCMVYTVLATRVHNSSVSQASIGNLVIGVASRSLSPPTLDVASQEFATLTSHVLHLANPDTLRSSWRYCIAANAMALTLMPPPSAGAPCLPFARHFTQVLRPGVALQLGRLAMVALAVQLVRVVEFGEANVELVSTVTAWLGSEGTGAALTQLMSSNHSTLDASEGSRDSRGGGGLASLQARLLNATHEELLLKVLAASLDLRKRWPESGVPDWSPEGVRQGLFEIPHATLVHLLASVAPAATLRVLRPAVEAATAAAAEQRVVTTSDKADQATAAECCAGLMAAGLLLPGSPAHGLAPGEPDGAWVLEQCGRQLLACTLEMSEGWAVALRFAVRAMLDRHQPPISLSRRLQAATAPTTNDQPPAATLPPLLADLPPQRALQGLQALLELARASGPSPMHLSDSTTADIQQLLAAAAAAPSFTAAAAGASPTPALLMQQSSGGPQGAAPSMGGTAWPSGLSVGTLMAAAGAAAAAAAAVGAGAGTGGAPGVGGGHVAVLKRLRYVHQCARELLTVAPSSATPQPVLAFWSATANELRQTLDEDLFTLRQQLGKTMALIIMQLGSGARLEDAAGAMEVDAQAAGAPTLTLHAARTAALSLERALLDAFASGTDIVQAIKLRSADTTTTTTTITTITATTTTITAAAAASSRAGASGGSEGATNGSNGSDADMVIVERPKSPVVLPDDESLKSITPPLPGSDTGSPTAAGAAAAAGALAAAAALQAAETAVGAGGGVTPAQHVAISRVGLGLGIVTWCSFHGDLVVLQPTLLAMLPQLFRLQELAGPVLQKMSHDAQFALALSKYWPVPPGAADQVLDCLTDAMSGPSSSSTAQGAGAASQVTDLWSVRAAALGFAQFWWFRNLWVISPAQATRLRLLVQQRLADTKPEVRAMAGATLSGMLRGMEPSEAQTLRRQTVAQAQQHLVPRPSSSSTAKAAGASSSSAGATQAQATLLEKHALVQGLAAFLQSSPYDCPEWMPSVLMALVRPASAQHGSGLEAAVRTAAGKALSEFKRTHEEDSLDALRRLMSEDDWDRLQQATRTGSYFT